MSAGTRGAYETQIGESAARFAFQVGAAVVAGPVMGRGGGMVSCRLQMERAVRLLGLGRAHMVLYEPRAGHVAVFPDFTRESDGMPVIVPLAAYLGEL